MTKSDGKVFFSFFQHKRSGSKNREMLESSRFRIFTSLAATGTTVLILKVIYTRWYPPRIPKNYSHPLENSSKRKSGTDATRDSFRKAKIPKNVDYILVGSGMGSMYTAALLSKAGKKCLVLEQHYVAGGCTHSFEDKGFEFDTGLHYVGRIEKYKTLIDLVSTGKRITWEKMGTKEDDFTYDEIKLGNETPFRFPAGEENLIMALVKEFPDEEDGIRKYIALCKRANKTADMYFYGKIFWKPIQKFLNRFVNGEYFSYAMKSTWEVVCECVKSKRLRAILCGQFGDYGLKPEESSFLIQAGITAHYLDGAYYPVGGSQEISRALIGTIEKTGGRVLVSCRAKSIEINSQGVAVGLNVVAVDKSGQDKGELINISAGKGVISGVGAIATHYLVPEGPHRDKLGFGKMIETVGRSVSHVYGFIGLKGTTEELGLRAANLWVLPVDENYKYKGAALDNSDKSDKEPWNSVGESPTEEDMLLFVGFPSVKDPTYNDRFPNKSACEIITTAHSEWFDKYETSDRPQSGKRDNEEYTSLKCALESKLLNGLHRNYPKTKGQVEYINVGTPLTNKYYLGRSDSYGLEHTPQHYSGALDNMRPKTEIKGLWCTGQDFCTVGIVGALNGGILTAHSVLGYGLLDLVVYKRNLIEDLMRME